MEHKEIYFVERVVMRIFLVSGDKDKDVESAKACGIADP